MTTYLVQHLRAKNDSNGNPRRCFVFYSPQDGEIVDVIDEGYRGGWCITQLRGNNINIIQLPDIEVGPREYKDFLKLRRGVLI